MFLLYAKCNAFTLMEARLFRFKLQGDKILLDSNGGLVSASYEGIQNRFCIIVRPHGSEHVEGNTMPTYMYRVALVEAGVEAGEFDESKILASTISLMDCPPSTPPPTLDVRVHKSPNREGTLVILQVGEGFSDEPGGNKTVKQRSSSARIPRRILSGRKIPTKSVQKRKQGSKKDL